MTPDRNIKSAAGWAAGAAAFILASLLMLYGGYAYFSNHAIYLESEPGTPAAVSEDERASWPELRVIVATRYSPSAGAVYHRELLDDLGNRLKRRITMISRKTYDEAIQLIKEGRADVGFICAGSFVLLDEAEAVSLIAVPVMYGRSQYRSYVIVPQDSPIRSFGELRGKTFAMTDPMSNSGSIYPSYRALQLGSLPDAFFGKIHYTYSADKSIAAVVEGLVDGAAVDGLIWENLSRTDPGLTARTRVIERSPWFAMPPIVARADLDPGLVEEIRRALLAEDQDPDGREILGRMFIERFTAEAPEAYGEVETMVMALREAGVNFVPR